MTPALKLVRMSLNKIYRSEYSLQCLLTCSRLQVKDDVMTIIQAVSTGSAEGGAGEEQTVLGE